MSGRNISMIISLCGHCHGNIECDEHGLKRSRREVEALLLQVMRNGWHGVSKRSDSQAINFDTADSYLEKILIDASRNEYVTMTSEKARNLVNEIKFHRSQAR